MKPPLHMLLCHPAGYPAHHHAQQQLSESGQSITVKNRLHVSPPWARAALQLFPDPNWILLFIFVLPPIPVQNLRPAALELPPNCCIHPFLKVTFQL